ncbi:DNA polymerase III subunit gamma/tau [Leptotrichia sp. oral taxon 847]|uniref:DNA polymerase III subunit gamma/tau n=1 Tax=Leptotrichia sp. oral taxon 847 TaxID=1785996 RepID=UPI002FFB154F
MRILNITLYRKYRPQNFDEIAGQEFVTRAIKNSLRENKLSHAYLFNGPRGVGKTTIARLIAKGVNCLNSDGITDSPCGVCENCVEISKGISMDMVEIDAASNRGIDEIRELKEKINYRPVKGRKKIYIIDEVHMLTKEAFNALLKTLEEPPSHIIFILATTEIDKIPDTVISRCQRYDFLPINKKDITKLLKTVAFKEDIEIDEKSLDLIYQKSEGSARDSFSIFEQVVSNYPGEAIDILMTQKALGVVPEALLKEFLDLILLSDKEKLIDFVDKIWEDGVVIETFLKDFSYYLKEQFRKESNIEVNFLLDTISSIYATLNEFKYEEDKRLLGYVLVHELYKNNKSVKDNIENVQSFDFDTKEISNSIYRKVMNEISLKDFEKAQTKNDFNEDKKKKAFIESSNLEKETDISVFRNNWRKIISGLEKVNIAFQVYFQNAKLLEVKDNVLYIAVESNFSAKMIMEKNKKEIEEIVNKICKTDIEIKALVLKNKVKSESKKFLDKMTEFFEGEILESKY